MLFSAKISDLTKQLETLRAAHETLTATHAEAERLNAEFNERHTLNLAAINTLTAERDALKLEVAGLQTKLASTEASVATRVETGIIEGIAAAGVPAVKRAESARQPDAKAPPAGTPRQRLAATFNDQLSKK